jgi:predicted acylesterase/phospholipase RssA
MPGMDIHAGIWRALSDHGIHATDCIGTSAGAIVSAMDAAGWTSAQARDFIAGLKDRDVRHELFAWKARIPFIDHWLSSEGIARILAANLPDDFAALPKPLRVCCTRVADAARTTFGRDYGALNLREAVLASMSISGVFPWVRIGDTEYCDGGVRANVPLPDDYETYDEVWLLIATRPTFYRAKRRNMLSRLILNVDWLLADQLFDVLGATINKPKVKVLWPQVGGASSMLRFNHRLIGEAYTLCSKDLLARGFVPTAHAAGHVEED